ncbi:unnamed protein product [Triticum turgidum subsp. durum]|uniref:DUF7036 domain-containing protein n=1 Tax=Triticum turgidum subsp. durum TaxID=4567 RepID=A0A9R0V7K0_TRITD|nr:unnamed protein product [Triticum turgidum subsp. durum]
MGKAAGGQREQPPGAAAEVEGEGRRRGRSCSSCRRSVRPQCVAALLLGAAVLLSALFWLPPFAGRDRGRRAGPPDPPADALAADIVASFMLQKTVSELNESIPKLEFDIYEEIGIPNSTVAVNFLQPSGASNWTNVIFSSTLQLTESLFGNSSFFEVLKFPGGITIIPPQAAFLVQKPYASFNFTLNFSIDKVQDKTNELKDQMRAGLLLDTNEILYIKLTNLEGSTVAPPTVVRSSIILEVGNHQPSPPRMKQLAQTIANSSSGNLGLNHTVFGKVKQLSLSSYLRHSLHSGSDSDAPSPAPMTHEDHRRHHHHHHHHRHHHHHHHHHHHSHHRSHEVIRQLPPSPAPVHPPVEQPKYRSPSPSGYSYGYTNKPKNKAPVAPAAEPVVRNHHYASPPTMPHAVSPSSVSPSPSARHPTNIPNRHHSSPAPSPANVKPPLHTVSLAHAHHPAQVPAVAPAPSTSFATRRHSCQWALAILLCLLAGLP